MATHKIALIIPVFNGLEFTSKCLKNLKDIFDNIPVSKITFQIIIIDDGSTDGSASWINTNYPDVIVLKGNGNLWWSGGINVGTRYALEKLDIDYVLWWNNDIIAENNYFLNLLQIINEIEKNVIAGSKIYIDNDSSTIWSMGGIFNPRNGEKFMTAMGEPDSEKYNSVFDADWLPGMGTLIHSDVFKVIGYLDEKNFPQYHGDSDYTYRAKLAGYQIKVFPQLKIWNDKTNSGLMHQNSFRKLIRSLNNTKSGYYLWKDILFYQKYSSSPMAYQTLIAKYCLYIGGFFKWKILNLFGIKKKQLDR